MAKLISQPVQVIGTALAEKIGIDPKTIRRITIDLEVGQIAMMRIERFPTEEELDTAVNLISEFEIIGQE